MHLLRRLGLGLLIGLSIGLSAQAPATAVTPAASTVASAATGTTVAVTGQPWSAPAFPVDCVTSERQVSCTPQNAADIKPQQCFINVMLSGARSTVCTTYAGHASALQGAGGQLLTVEYGCSLGDLVCITFENAGRGMAMSATGAMLVVAQNMRFDTGSLLWTAAVGEWSFWQWAILIVLFIAMVWAITAAIVSGDRDQLIGAVIRSFIAIPAVPITLWATGHLLNAIDDLTWYIMNRDGPLTLFSTLQGVMWAGGQANYFFAFLIHGLLLVSMLLLTLVFAFRNIALAALIAVGPLAWMVFPVRGVGVQWVIRYASAVAALLLTGPLTIGFVTLIINGLAGVRTIWDPQSWPLLIGLVLAAFAPFAVFGLFSFAGSVAADSIGSRIGSGAGRAASNTARSAARIPTRLGATPAGVSAAGVSAGTRTASAGAARSATDTAAPSRGGARPAGARPGGSAPAGGSSSTPPSPASSSGGRVPVSSSPTAPAHTPVGRTSS